MSKSEQERIAAIERALVAAHRTRPEPELDEAWQRRVLAEVRGAGRSSAREVWLPVVQRSVWRFAAVAGTLALAVSLYGLAVGISPERVAAQLFIDDPAALVVASLDLR